MAKDPAFLFYSADFYMGTIDMTDEQVGQYIRLMCLQHQKGRLTEQLMRNSMRGRLDKLIVSKFETDEDGRYYNVRLEEEIEKRQKYTNSRKRNLNKRSSNNNAHMDAHMDAHMETHMETHMGKHSSAHMENENENEIVNENKDTKEIRKKHGQYGWVLLTVAQFEKLESDLGTDEMNRCIAYVDESAQATGNKNKWKDWNLVIRKCSRDGWGKNRRQGGEINAENNGSPSGFRASTRIKDAGL